MLEIQELRKYKEFKNQWQFQMTNKEIPIYIKLTSLEKENKTKKQTKKGQK